MNAYFVFLISLFLVIGASAAYSEHSKNECRIELAKAGKSTEDINKICN